MKSLIFWLCCGIGLSEKIAPERNMKADFFLIRLMRGSL